MAIYKTDCKECVFNGAALTPHKFVDCQMNGRYKIFKSRGQVAEDGTTINRLCTTCRDSNWAEQFKGVDWDEQVFTELTQAYTLIIVDEEEGDVLERLKESLKNPQTIKPLKIILVYSSSYSMDILNDWMRANVKSPFSITRIDEQDYERELIDMVVKNASGHFYTIQQNGIPLNPQTFYTMYYYLEVLLEKVLVVHNLPSRFEKDYHGLTVSTFYHKRVNGNAEGKIEEKTHLQNDSTENAWVIKRWEQLYSMCNDHKNRVYDD